MPADVLSRQALDGQAEDLALEDTLYSLDKALQAGSLTPEAYIKQVIVCSILMLEGLLGSSHTSSCMIQLSSYLALALL